MKNEMKWNEMKWNERIEEWNEMEEYEKKLNTKRFLDCIQ
jgi:hypothetical protein